MFKSIFEMIAERLIAAALKPLIYLRRMAALKRRGWYKNLAGSMCSAHCEAVVLKKEIFWMSEEEFLRLLRF